MFCNMIPKDFIVHLGNAKKEVLLAAKSVIEEEIKRVDKRMESIINSEKQKKEEEKDKDWIFLKNQPLYPHKRS